MTQKYAFLFRIENEHKRNYSNDNIIVNDKMLFV